MRTFIRYLFLLVPLCWYIDLWGIFVFDIKFFNFNIGGGLLVGLWLLIFTLLSFIIGATYTYFKKLWYWFAAYVILGGFPVFYYFGGLLGAKLGFW